METNTNNSLSKSAVTLEKKKPFNSNTLKLFAIIAMTIDHVTSVVWPGYRTEWWILPLHMIGRLTAPTMCFFIAEGAFYTRNWKKYALRLFIFAVVSHFAYAFCFGLSYIPFKKSVLNQTSVIYPLFIGLIAIQVQKNTRLKEWQKLLINVPLIFSAFPSDWSSIAALCVLAFYKNRGNLKKQISELVIYVFFYALIYAIFADSVYGWMQMCVVICVPFLMNYNGERGSWKGMKWFFYLYYPAHLILLGFLRLYLHGDVGCVTGAF